MQGKAGDREAVSSSSSSNKTDLHSRGVVASSLATTVAEARRVCVCGVGGGGGGKAELASAGVAGFWQ